MLTAVKSTIGKTRPNLSEEEKQHIHKLYFEEGKSTREISENLGLNQTTIPKVIKRMTGKSVRKYAGNINYFDAIDTRAKAYFLGFIAADGCIVDNSRISRTDTLSINIHNRDTDILEKFRQELNREQELYIFIDKSQVGIRINHQHICDSLRQHGLDYRKSMTLENIYPLIPTQYWGAFTQGYFEGDGYISPNKSPNQGTKSKKIYKFATIGFCGTRNFLHGLAVAANLQRYSFSFSPGHGVNSEKLQTGIFVLSFASKAEVNRIFTFMYSDADFVMNRKYSKFLPYIEDSILS